MPRKKVDSVQASLPDIEQPKTPKPRASRSKVVEQPAAPPIEVAVPKVTKPKKPINDTEAMVVQPKSQRATKPRTLAEEVAAQPEVPAEPKAPAEKKPSLAKRVVDRLKAKKPAAKPVAQAVTPATLATDDDADGFLMLEWRARSVPDPQTPRQHTNPEGSNLAPRKSKRRRRKDHGDLEISAAEALVVPEPVAATKAIPERRERRPQARREAKPALIATPVAPPSAPLKALIPIPEDAPQVVLRNGIPILVRKHRVYPPIAFFGSSPDEQRAKTVFEEIKMAGEAGVHLHSHLVEFEVDPEAVAGSVSFAAYLLAQTLVADPEAQVLFRVVFVAPAGWTDKYSDAKYLSADGSVGEPSVCDDKFWDVARNCLKSFVRQLRLLEVKDHILGIHLERGEWFYSDDWGYDTSVSAKQGFRDWARTRYGNDEVALRAAWFDGTVSFENLSVPPYRAAQPSDKFVRSNRKERKWVDYHLFLSDATVERIGDLAYAVKEASEGYFLAGASYGYTFEWSHPASGHLSLGKLLRTPEIDFVAGPPSYRSREPGGAAPFPGPIDSFALNGKLYISEEDFKTSIGSRYEPDDFNPVIKTPQALESVHWRGAGAAFAHGTGVCWMDLWGNGWLKTHGTWDRAAKVKNGLINRMAAPQTDPDVAVFIDERALAYLVNQKAFALLVQNVRESVLRSGLSAGFYLLSDLQHRERFPESKLYIFLNAWDIRPELRSAIKNRLQKDNKVLFWLYAAGQFDSGRESLERAREVTGIALKAQPFFSKTGTTILNRRHPLSESFRDKGIVAGSNLEPSYFAIPEEASVLGEYSATGLPSFVVREFGSGEHAWKSVFLGEPLVTPDLVRALGQIAGAHVWNFQGDVVHVRAPFLSIHCAGAGPRTITLPDKWVAYNCFEDQWAVLETNNLRFNAIDGSTHQFYVGLPEDIEAILQADPEGLLRMDELPTRPDDTLRFDATTFDVPIMRLDQWMEGEDQDDLTDDFLFKPRLIEELPEDPETQVGRRRRRRGRGRGNDEPIDRREGDAYDKDLDMNIMFRKRE